MLLSFPRNKYFLKSKWVLSKDQPSTSSNCRMPWPVVKHTLAGAQWFKKPGTVLSCTDVGSWVGEAREVGKMWILWLRKCLTSSTCPFSFMQRVCHHLSQAETAKDLRFLPPVLCDASRISWAGTITVCRSCIMGTGPAASSPAVPRYLQLHAWRAACSQAQRDADAGDHGGVVCPWLQQRTVLLWRTGTFSASLKGWY